MVFDQVKLKPGKKKFRNPTSLKNLGLWTVPSQSTILVGGAQTFTSTDKCSLQIADASQTGLDPGTSDFSICGWVYISATGTTTSILYKQDGTSSTGAGYSIYEQSGSLKCVVSNGTQYDVATLGTVATGQWYFAAITYDKDGNLTGYLNGTAGTPVAVTSFGSIDNAFPLRMGVGYSERFLSGTMSLWSFHSRVLTPAEITTLYNNKNLLPYADWSAALKVGLVSVWPLNESVINSTAGTNTARDLHGTNHLTFTNAEMLSNTGFETRTGVTGASFASGDKAHLEAADADALDLATGDFLLNVNELRTSAGEQVIASKYQDADNYWTLKFNASSYVQFTAKAGGAVIIDMISSTTACTSTSTKYHIEVAVDRSNIANCKIFVNNTSQAFSLSPSSVEKVTNGTFDTDSGWTKGTGWTVDNADSNVATHTGGSGTWLSGLADTVTGASYTTVYTITGGTSPIVINLGGTSGSNRSNPGTYTEILSAGATTGVGFWTGSVTALSIDNVSVKPCIHLLDSTTSISNTGKLYVGQNGDGTLYQNGRIAMFGIAKPADVSAAAVTTAITNIAGASGLGQYYNEQSTADKTALAWSVFYDMTEASGTRSNRVNPGTNDLSEVLTVNLLPNPGFETRGTNGGLVWNVRTATYARASNVATIVTGTNHGLVNGNVVTVSGLTDSSFNATGLTVTRVDDTTFTYASTGSDVGAAADTNGHIYTDVFASVTEDTSAGSTDAITGNGLIEADSVNMHGGSLCAALTQNSAPGYIRVTQYATTVSGRSYNLGMWVKAASGTVGIGGKFSTSANTTYAQKTMTVTASSASTAFDVFLTSGKLYLDDMSFTAASIPCASDADVVGSWTESGAGGTLSLETVAPLASSVLSLRMRRISDVVSVSQSVLTSGHTYDLSLAAKISDESSSGELKCFSGTTESTFSLTTSSATYTASVTASGSAAFQVAATANAANKDILLDTVSVKCTSLVAANGPSTAIASDSVGTNHGTLTGFTAAQEVSAWSTDVPTQLGSGMSLTFDGVANYVDCGTTVGEFGGSNDLPFTVCGWVRRGAGQAPALASRGPLTGTSNLKWFVYVDASGNATAACYSNAAVNRIGRKDTSATVSTDTWFHVCMTYDGSKSASGMMLYVNGTRVDDADNNAGSYTGMTTGAVTMLIGGVQTSAFGAGKLKDVRIYNAALSAANIAALAAGTDYRTNLVSQWLFNDGSQASPSNGDPALGIISSEGSRLLFNQATIGNRPIYTNPTAALNNQPTLYFDGTNDLLRYVGTFGTSDTAGTLFFIWMPSTDVTTNQAIFSTEDEASATKFWRTGIEAGKIKYNQNDAGTADTLAGGVVGAGVPYLVMLASDGSTITAKINNTAVTFTASSGANNGDWLGDVSARDSVILGASNANNTPALFSKGWMGSVVYYSRQLTAGEIGRVNRYLATLYGITLT